MEKRGQLMTYLWVLSLMALPLSNLPNRILLGLLLLWFFLKQRSGFLQVDYFNVFAGSAVVLLILSAVTNQVLSKELLLALSIPAQGLFLVIVRPDFAQFKRGFHAGVITILLVLMAIKFTRVAQMGFDTFFSQEQWWNLWHYKSFTESLSLHPTYLSLFLLAGMTMLLFGSDKPTLKDSLKGPGLALFGLYLLGLWLISSKIAIIASGMLLLIFWVWKLRRSTKRQSLVISILIGIAIIPALTSPSIRHRLTHELSTAVQTLPTDVPSRLTERRALWKSALIDMDQHPLLGTSLRGVKSRQAIYPKAKFLYSPLEKPMNAHNNFIEFGLRYGLLFGILFLISSIFGLYKAFRKRSLELLGFGLVCIIVSMTESFIFREQGLSLTALMLLFYYLTENEGNI